MMDIYTSYGTHIGSRLRRARDDKGLATEEVAKELNIQTTFIEAIEALNTEALPSIGYVLGYVRSYAGLVGLDPQEAVDAYKADVQVPTDLGLKEDLPHYVPQRQIRLPKGFFAASTLASCALVMALWYGSNTAAQSSALTTVGEVKLESAAAETVPVDPNAIIIKATAPSWVQIKDKNGKVIISRILVAGESWQSSSKANETISARDSGALDIYRGETRLGTLGTKGTPVADIALPEFNASATANSL